MNKTYFVLLFLLSFGTACSSASIPWNKFVDNPDEESHSEIGKQYYAQPTRCKRGEQSNYDIISQDNSEKLFVNIRSGNKESLSAAFMIIECFDGGTLEDFYKSAGLFFELHPSDLLQIVSDKGLIESSFKSMITMLPENTVDNLELQIATIKKRISKIEMINNKELMPLRNKGAEFLREKVKFLESLR